ncbi:PREDICTED: uncharacterized protein LOC109174869 [Ipomoea nil]|uniref:uncharacterized protein LOC109174869 n=1 Tax=Ipomoea nil TaxID=35883 RepID=UPI0009013133|nr:PREDICTED: uncharacterized protein LOC109174869 [Ipomoea nil]XP_019179648.1 PREDICTED: uncharacterized protein LOC109174869 [Ipomoea nil]XP_019179649.1 PREDICTED: uncharacterized protein LOC109174869 [Ipomoea nil]
MDPKSGVIVTKEREWMTRIENPFTLKVGQVFTGFGIGCGIGIGVGRPINLGAIPMVNQVMVATRGATDAFSGVGRHVNNSLRHLGVKNIEAGIGCGIGFGHGFGIGLAVKPGVVHQIQSCLAQLAAKAMMKFGMAPDLLVGQGIVPKSIQTGIGVMNETSTRNPLGNVMPVQPKVLENFMPKDGLSSSFSSNETSDLEKNPLSTSSYSSRTENVISNFLQTPLFKGGENEASELAERLRSENNLLHLVLKHQQVIEELMRENEKLRQILVEDLKVSPAKLQASYSSGIKSPCSECFDCRRKQRRR